jgi:hypothetical protein
LKLFIFDSIDSFSHRFFQALLRKPPDTAFSTHAQKKAIQTLEACRLAYQYLPDETAILYLHLHPGSDHLPTIHLRGPTWNCLPIQSETLRFVLQKRANPLDQSLMQAYLNHDRSRFFYLIDQLNVLLDRRIACGIRNTDPTLFENFGVIGDQPIEIDFGNYTLCPDFFLYHRADDEKARYTDQLIQWVERSIPQWKDDVVMRIKSDR